MENEIERVAPRHLCLPGLRGVTDVSAARTGLGAEPLPGDGKLHIPEGDLDLLAEQVLLAGRKIVDGRGLKVFVRFDERLARSMTFDLLVKLTKAGHEDDSRYDLVLGDIQ